MSQEHAEGLRKLAREKAEWEEQKNSQMQAFQAQQEEQVRLRNLHKQYSVSHILTCLCLRF